MHLVYACLRFVLYSVHIECMLRMRLLISVTTLTSNYHAIEDCTSIYHVCCTRSMHAATKRYCIIWEPSWGPMRYCIVRGPSIWGPSVSISIDIVTARTSYAIGLKHNMCLFRDDVIHALMCSLASQELVHRQSQVTLSLLRISFIASTKLHCPYSAIKLVKFSMLHAKNIRRDYGIPI